jgi:hypothetical protein
VSKSRSNKNRQLSRKETREQRKLEARAEREFQKGMRNLRESDAPRGPRGDRAMGGK